MMRKKQIFRMLFGAFVACMAAACSNETDVLNGFPTDGNTISVNLRTNDIGATTRAIATDDESKVESLSAYLFGENENDGYTLEKVYNSLAWNSSDETHSVALTGIKERGPKKVYFVANGTSIKALKNVSAGLPEAEFQALLMDEMEANPTTPLPMTAQAELAEWSKEVNNAIIAEPAMLKRISARIDLKVDGQEGLTFAPTSIALTAAASSYIFPNEEGAYNGSEETVEISGTTLYPYEAAAGTVKEVKVTGIVTVGGSGREATFVVPFVNEDYTDGIAIERNHRYTVHITRINGFYSVEATVTVSDWNTADLSGELKAGEELKMTATEFADEALSDAPAATAVYPAEGGTKSATVELKAEDAKVYKIWVGSANIEAVTSWGELELPDGWKIEKPADTRAEYLWEKSYWTLTIPANDSQKTKSLTIKAVNKLELAKDENTEKYVKITFTQNGKEETVDHSKNPLLKWAETDLQRSGYSSNVQATFANNYTTTGSYYQFGRNYGFTSVSDAAKNYGVERSDMTPNRNVYPGTGSTSPVSTYYASNINFGNYPNYFFIDNNHGGDYTTPARQQTWSERAQSNGYSYNSPCPKGWRIPTISEYKEIMPVINDRAGNTGNNAWNTLVQFKTLDNIKCAFRWSKYTRSSYSYLKIECLVVNNNTTDITQINWNEENVVTRYFKGAGYIQAHRNLWQLNSSTHYTARPMEWGTYEGIALANGTVRVALTKSYMTYGGFYWTSDATQGVFSMIFNNSTGYTLGYYLSTYDSPIGANIRCIKDNE